MRGPRACMAICVTVAALAAGCGDDDAATDASSPTEPSESADDASTADGDSDDSATQVAGSSVPLPPQADAVATSESGPITIVQFIVPLDRQDATIAFYDDWTAAQPDEYQRAAAENGGVSWQNAPETGAEKNIIAVLSPLAGDDFVAVTLTSGPAE